MVDKVSGWGAIPFKPHEFGGVQDSSNGELVPDLRVDDILPVNDLLQVHEPLDQGISGSTLQYVVKSSTDKHSHWSCLPLVLHMEGVGEVDYGPPRDGVPIDMEGVRVTHDARFSRVVDIMQLAVTQHHI